MTPYLPSSTLATLLPIFSYFIHCFLSCIWRVYNTDMEHNPIIYISYGKFVSNKHFTFNKTFLENNYHAFLKTWILRYSKIVDVQKWL
jgi:hypothetical protein